MNYLITGATGFIGPHLIKKLISHGHTCRCLVRPGSEGKVPKNPGVEIIAGDITRPETLKGIGENIDCLLHLATLGHMSNFVVTEEMFYKINVQGTLNIMKEALRSGIEKVVHCSSVAAMGICSEVPATEKTRCNPHHPYGRSKLEAERQVLRMVSEQGLPAVIIRFSMVYGPGDKRDILKLTRIAQKGFFPKVGNRQKLTPLIHVEDAIRGLLLASKKGRAGEIYLITNRESEPFDTILKIIRDTLGSKKPTVHVPEWAALAAASIIEKAFLMIKQAPPVSRKNIESTLADRVFSIEKAARELGFDPKVDPAEGLRDTVLWYRKNGWV